MIFKALWLDFQENFVGLYSKSNCELFVEQLTLRNVWMVEICRIDQRIYEALSFGNDQMALRNM